MSYKKIYMSFNIKRHIHARVIFRWYHRMNKTSSYSADRFNKTKQHTHTHCTKLPWALRPMFVAMGTPSHVHRQRRAIIITIFGASVVNCMVPSDWDLALFFFLALRCVCGLFCFLWLNRYWEINERYRGFFSSEPRELDPSIHIRSRSTSPQAVTQFQIFSVIFPGTVCTRSMNRFLSR